jgi:transcription-repair coupling factor (superfamily II helicase)
MTDRFGPLPPQVEDLFTTIRCRWLAVDLGFEKMSLKDDTLRCYFVNKNDSPYFESDTFRNVLQFLQTGTNKGKLKQVAKNFLLVVNDIEDMNELYRFLAQMHAAVLQPRP